MVPIIPREDVDESRVEQLLSAAFIATKRDPQDNLMVVLLDGTFHVTVLIYASTLRLTALWAVPDVTRSFLEALNEFNREFDHVKAYTYMHESLSRQILVFESYVQINDGLYPPHLVRMLREMEETVKWTSHSLEPYLE